MTSTRLTRGALIAAAVALVTGGALTGCSSDDDGAADAAPSSSTASSSAAPTSASTEPVGAGCAQLTADPAVVAALQAAATQPVGTAASALPPLSTLASVVGQANLTAALDAQSGITVLAPANAAFDAVPADQLNALVADLPRLTSVLQHHAIPGRLSPEDLVGEHTTLLGDTVTVTGTADAPVVAADQTLLGAADATLVCGNLPTANATVYVIDQVLAPEA
ncbi:Uncaracterized surface protein containing fasciclin (FAS1) repeats [Klenkia marina]|uniref:Uncaracterized surface protein containing fasciclin (FAS1) repeats n=1 Tax=Klenkia marina TaxID=1960309 RepID=A0A1G4XW88_9ACTN|nr:fasciclin domain-containing protein [Klenkia marina]SCX45467.1 Uncaracterized surface protein containing fasciclin (FAS1) repeats [Klenkia marina]